MTYPAQPQYPPGYSPTAYPPAPAGGYPAAVAQAQQPNGGPQHYGQPSPAPGADPFTDPSGGGSISPHPRNLVGRTVIVKPIRVDENATYQGQSRPTAYYDLVVVDGGPGTFGESLERGKERPPTHSFTAPAYFRNAMGGSAGIVDVCRNNPGGLVVGVIEQGTKGNRPYLLTKTHADLDGNPRPDGDARRKAAQDLWFRIVSGEVRATVPTLLGAPTPGQPQPQVSYGQPPAQPATGYYGPTDAARQPAPAWAPPAAQPQYQPAAVAAQPNGDPPPPPGWDAQSWANFPPEAKAGIWAQINAAPMQPQQGGQPVSPTPTGW